MLVYVFTFKLNEKKINVHIFKEHSNCVHNSHMENSLLWPPHIVVIKTTGIYDANILPTTSS